MLGHRMVRDGLPFIRPNTHRTVQRYKCSCGYRLFGDGRREALDSQKIHRWEITTKLPTRHWWTR